MICVSSYFFWLLYLSDLLKVLRRVISGTGYMLLYSEGPDRTSKYIWSISHDMSIEWICDLVDSKICSIAYGGWTEDRIPPYHPIHLYLFIITFPIWKPGLGIPLAATDRDDPDTDNLTLQVLQYHFGAVGVTCIGMGLFIYVLYNLGYNLGYLWKLYCYHAPKLLMLSLPLFAIIFRETSKHIPRVNVYIDVKNLVKNPKRKHIFLVG